MQTGQAPSLTLPLENAIKFQFEGESRSLDCG